MEINRKYARGLSRIGVRATYGQTLFELAQNNSSIMAISADLGRSSGLNQLRTNLPDQFVNAGIAEQNMVGVAAGMASQGLQVFASSFAPFISMRASEQVRMNLGYMRLPVKLVALGSGVSMGFLGNSHYGLEDAAVMRTIPGMTIVSPADCVELKKVLHAAAEFDGPMYIRLTGGVNAPIVYDQEYDFCIGRAHNLRSGDGSACILATGSSVALAMDVAEKFTADHGIQISVVNMHTIKPLDSGSIVDAFDNYSLVVTIEEHTVIGGVGSAVAEFHADNGLSGSLLRIGIPDSYVSTGDYAFALSQCGLTVDSVYEKILQKLEGRI